MEEAKKQFRELVKSITPEQWDAIYFLLKRNKIQLAREMMNEIKKGEDQK